MELKELAEHRNSSRFDEIIQWAEQEGIENIADGGFLLFVAEAYARNGKSAESIQVYQKALQEYQEEQAAESLTEQYIKMGDGKALQQLADYLEEECFAEESMLRAKFEAARSDGRALEEQLPLLQEYADAYYEERYYILLLEVLLELGSARFKRYLTRFKELFTNSPYEEYVAALEAAKQAEKNVPEKSIREVLYPAGTKNTNKESKKEQHTEAQCSVQTEAAEQKQAKEPSAPHCKAKSFQELLSGGLLSGIVKKVKSQVKEPPTMEERFENIVGMSEVRERIGKIYRVLRQEMERQSAGYRGEMLKSTHFSVDGAHGSGKTLLAETIGQMLADYGIRGEEQAVSIEGKDFCDHYEELNKLDDVTLLVENIDRCMDAQGKFGDFAWKLQKLLNDHKKDLSVIITGTKDAVLNLMAEESNIREALYDSFSIPAYSTDELVQMFEIITNAQGWKLTEDAWTLVRRQLDKEKNMSIFAGGKSLEEKLKVAQGKAADRNAELEDIEDRDLVMLEAEDFAPEGVDADVPELLKKLEGMVGLEGVKEKVQKLVENQIVNKEAENAGSERETTGNSLHLVFKGSPGTGKTTVARIIAKIYLALGVLPGNKEGIVEVSAADLMGMYVNETGEKTKTAINRAMGGVLFIDEAYVLMQNQFGMEAINAMLAIMENCRDSIMIIIAGYDDDIDKLLDANVGLRSRFGGQNQIVFEDYTQEEMYRIFKNIVKEQKYYLATDTADVIKELIAKRCKETDFGNARGVRGLVQEAKEALNARIGAKMQAQELLTTNDFEIICREDIETLLEDSGKEEKSVEELLQELDDMIGLARVKETVHRIAKVAQYNQWAKENGQADQNGHGSLHLLFKGNAGTGKTTVARMLGQIYYKLGMLRTGQCVECTRKDLVGQHVGDTAPLTQSFIDKAKGGILFVDEAYALMQGGENDFGQEALTTILKAMEDDRGDLMIVFAGYSEELDKLIASNQGFESRFSKQNEIIFDDYTEEELLQIFVFQSEKAGMRVKEELYPAIQEVIVRAKAAANSFGNARGVRNLVEAMNDRRKMRIVEEMNAGNAPSPKEAVWLTKADMNVV